MNLEESIISVYLRVEAACDVVTGGRQLRHLSELNKRVTETDQRLNRLYDATESGVADLNDDALKGRSAGFAAIRERAKADAKRAQAALDHAGKRAVSPAMVKTSELLRTLAAA